MMPGAMRRLLRILLNAVTVLSAAVGKGELSQIAQAVYEQLQPN